MTREEIIELAREAGIEFFNSTDPEFYGREYCEAWIEEQHVFAELIAAAERNKVAQWIMARGYSTGHGDTVEDLLKEFNWQVREEERELCAQLCEEFEEDMGYGIPQKCAGAIRARAEK